MLKLTLVIGRDVLDIEGDVSIGDALPVISAWLDALPGGDVLTQLALDQLTARLAAANTKLQRSVSAAGPPLS